MQQTVVDVIRDASMREEFASDQRLVEADLSERFAASRGRVRASLAQLESEGLVVRVPHRGARVRSASVAEAVELTQVRMVLASLCAAKAAEHPSTEDLQTLAPSVPPWSVLSRTETSSPTQSATSCFTGRFGR